MAKLIYKGTERTPLNNSGSLYICIETAIAKIMEVDEKTQMAIELYWSEKHKGYYLAAYAKK
jgi:hypothetical protein